MATTTINFGSQVEAWVRKTEARMLAVFRESTQQLVSNAQAIIPRKTGFARASVVGSLSAMPPIDPASRGQPDQTYADPQNWAATIAQAQLGDRIFIGWTAAYVGALENGHSKQAPSGFVKVSALEWPRIVSEATAAAKTRAGVG